MSSPHPLHNQSPHASPHGQEIYRKQKWLRPVLSAAQGVCKICVIYEKNQKMMKNISKTQ